MVGWAVDDGPAQSYAVGDLSRDHERRLLQDWFTTLEELYRPTDMPRFIGHNIIGFDLPFLWKRAMILGVKPPPMIPRNPSKYRSDSAVDTMLLWDQEQRAGGSMDRICRLMGLEGKGDMDGSQVWPEVQAGNIAKVATYCQTLTGERTRAMYKRMIFA